MPPTVKLEQPRPGQPNARSQRPQLGAVLEVDGPEEVPKQANRKRFPRAELPVPRLGLGERRLRPVEHELAPEQDAEKRRGKGDDLVDDLARPEVEGREGQIGDGQADGDNAGTLGRLPRGERGMQHGPRQAEHGELVDEFEGLAERRVEEEGADAEDEEGDGHEIPFWPQEAAAPWAVHGPQGERFSSIPRIDRSAGLGLPIVAPIHLVQSRGGPLGSPRGGVWGMNTSTTPHTPLETLLLFRGIAQSGLEDDDFAHISEALQSNGLVKNTPTYDARRLSPETLRDLFLRLLREELRSETEDTPGPDGALSPASKKRRLQSPPLLTLGDARQHVEKIEAAHIRLHSAYLQHAIDEIRQSEQQYDLLQRDIDELEKSGVHEPDSELKPQSSNGLQDAAGKHDTGPANGVGPSLGTSPRPPQIPMPHSAPQHPPRTLQPLLPHPVPRQDARNGPLPPQQPASEKASRAPRSPAPAYPELVRSPQLGQQETPRALVPRPTTTPKPPNGTPQVLQAPQGVTPFHLPPQAPALPLVAAAAAAAAVAAAEGLQRPESVVGARQSPALPPASPQLPTQGQLKWEPPYQPHAPPRPTGNTNLQHQLPNRPAQQPPPPPSPHQVLIPPHSTVRPPADAAAGPGPNRQQPLLPITTASGVSQQPPPPYHPQYQGHLVATSGQATPVHPIQVAQAHPTPVHPGPGRSPGVPPTPMPPVTVAPRPGPGLAAPPQQRPQPPNLQASPFNPQRVLPDAAQRYTSPYQPPRPAAVDRIHPRLPVASTPTPATRFSPALPAPQTPVMMLPARLAAGSGTKWVSRSTPSTPKPGLEFRLGYDDVPSPAYEPTSPILRPSAPPGTKEVRREGTILTPKQKPGRPHIPQRAQAGVSAVSAPHFPPVATPSAAGSRARQTSQATGEARVKTEATTPRPSTETGDTTADDSVTGRPRPPRLAKRKRDDLTPTPVQTPMAASQIRDALPEGLAPHDGPKLVLWTRSFNKVCGSAMEQIVHHRSANMFAAPIREKDAPGYHKVVKQAQDLKTIRAAINHGNRAAAQAAAALPDGGDPGTSSVWLPRTEDLVPPKSIVNSSQLDRELAHMFSNAVMYNPDPHHGPGPAFLRDVVEDLEGLDAAAGVGGGGAGAVGSGSGGGGGGGDSGVLGYKVDEFGVVNDARAMFVEVEKLLSELRSAEVRRNVPPGAGGNGGGGATGTMLDRV
ncbi:hypothetical protein C8A00DRAFT_44341 [Chaetomidium leptoderma]|uniref:Bromo domain-containing protein n=1 Tax=Chaetomidium leptoderma TaxID=669021 RepID=A0AAN6ZVM5_9PEZI|nr:hypothetical protein C8A00DRAFT_44341 [Chaetomidium leptoderma]